MLYRTSGATFPGTRAEIIDYMRSVGYQHIPDGHKERGEKKDHFMSLYNILFSRAKSTIFLATVPPVLQ
jgi:hypothetical protein